MDKDTYDIVTLWVGLVITVIASLGSLIGVLANARKTSAEAVVMKAKQKELIDSQKRVLSQVENPDGQTMLESNTEIKTLVKDMGKDISGIRNDLRQLASVDLEDRHHADLEHEKIYQTISVIQQDVIRLNKLVDSHIDTVPDVLEKHRQETIKMFEERYNDPKE